MKATLAERFIRTLKELIYKYISQNNTKTYLPVLQQLVRIALMLVMKASFLRNYTAILSTIMLPDLSSLKEIL